MEMPHNADTFIAFMEDVWRGDCEASPDGGTIVIGSPLYDEWHDARKVARAIGARKLYGAGRNNGEPAYHYDLPTGERIAIGTRGQNIRKVNKHV